MAKVSYPKSKQSRSNSIIHEKNI